MRLTVNKKIVSIAFLVLALFMLLAVSYAYFTARVEGNEEAKEINVTAGIMSVKLTGPDEITAEHLIPGQSVSIFFQVENTGTVPAIYNLDMIEVTNNFNPTSDLVYTITSTNNGGHVQDKEAPTKDETLIRNILIQPGEENIQEYTLTLLFKETKVNQDTNQNKAFEGKVQINNLEDNTMATKIIRTNKLQTNELDFSHASPEETCDNYNSETKTCEGIWTTTDYGKGMFAAEDDDGTSYYYRGAVENNNVHFADMDWKILRINGDGSIRLILNKEISSMAYNTNFNGHKYVGYTYDNSHDCTQEEPCVDNLDSSNLNNYEGMNSEIKTYLDNWYLENLEKYNNKILLTKYCNDTSIVRNETWQYYGSNDRTYEKNNFIPDLKCPNPTDFNSQKTHNYGGVYKLKIGLITADELNMMGYIPDAADGRKVGNIFLKFNIWTMSPANSNGGTARMLKVVSQNTPNYRIYYSSVHLGASVLPVINLKPDVSFTTNGSGEPGTADNPYIIK